jgi:DNA-directed RNA polymerase specialized sigma24 family protein
MSTSLTSLEAKFETFRGFSNSELLEQEEVQSMFYFAARQFYAQDSWKKSYWEDLAHRAFLMFLGAAPIKSRGRGKFKNYIFVTVKHAIIKADKYRYRKKRHLPATHFAHDRVTGRPIEPKGQSAVILFDHDEVTLIRAILWKNICCEDRRVFVMNILDAFLDGETQSETAKRMGVRLGRIDRALRTIGRALEGAEIRSRKVSNEAIRKALKECDTKKAAAKQLGLSYGQLLVRAANLEDANE